MKSKNKSLTILNTFNGYIVAGSDESTSLVCQFLRPEAVPVDFFTSVSFKKSTEVAVNSVFSQCPEDHHLIPLKNLFEMA